METLNSIGFCNFWGVTPSSNILSNEYSNNINKEINILLSNTNDTRHILKTVSNTFEKLNQSQNENFPNLSLNFFIFESFRENLARTILFFHIIHDRSLSIRDRVELMMEIYGNTLLSSRTAEYINSAYKELVRFICGDSKYKGALRDLIDISQLTYKEKDELMEIFSSYDLKIPFDIEKYREDRLRYMHKERYDYRDNVADWDYQMNMKNFAPIVSLRHYTDFRRSGTSFEMRICKYNVPNRTLGSYIPGREKKSKDSCLVRGFWGDLVNSPFIGFGVELDNEEEFTHFYKHNNINYVYNAQEITEFNLNKFLYRIEKNESFDYLAEEKERRRLRAIEKQKEEEALAQAEAEKNNQNTNIKEEEGKEEVITTTTTTNTTTNDNSSSTNPSSDTNTLKDYSEVLNAFQKLRVKIVLLSGNVESLFKKKKYLNLFDFIVMGLYSKNIFPNISQIGNANMKVLLELNSFMTCYKDEQKNEFKEKMKILAADNNLILEDSSSKHMWKFIYRKSEEKENVLKEVEVNVTNVENVAKVDNIEKSD